MKCEWVQENILLYIYNELQDDARYELEQHLARCAGCATELKASRQFHAAISRLPVEEPSPNLLASSRMRLQESLETTEQGGFWQRLIFDPGAWLRPIKFAPALAAAILMVGFAAGIGVTYQLMSNRIPGRNYSNKHSRRIFHRRHPLSRPEARFRPDQHQVRHCIHAAGAGFAQRSAYPAVTALRRTQQLQLRCAHGFG